MLEKLLRWIHVDPTIFSRLDPAEKNLITILAISIPCSSILAALVFYYSVHLLLGSILVALVVAVFLGFIMYLHDSTLLSEAGKTRAIARLILSVVIALIVAVPLKIKFMGESLENQYLAGIKSFNLEIEKELMAEKQVILDEEAELHRMVQIASVEFSETGKSQPLVEARRIRDAFLKEKDQRIAELETMYSNKMKPLEVTKLDQAAYFFTHMFSKSSPKELFINLTVFIFLLLGEALPAIVRLKLENSKFLSKVIHKKMMSDKADAEIEEIEKSIFDLDSLEGLEGKIDEISIWGELESVSKGGFRDVEKLKSLVEKYKAKKQVDSENVAAPPPSDSEKDSNSKTNSFPEFDYSK